MNNCKKKVAFFYLFIVLFRMLMSKGAAIDIKNGMGQLPAHLTNNKDVLKLIQENTNS